MDKKALIVIDMQKDFLWRKRKTMFSYNTDILVKNVNRAINLYKAEGYDIIYIKHILPKLLWGVGFSIKGTEGAELCERVNVVSDYIFEKNRANAFTSRPFREFMKKQGYGEIVLCGIDECACVRATAKGAVNTKIKVRMLTDCIGCRFSHDRITKIRNELKELGVEYIEAYAQLTESVEDALDVADTKASEIKERYTHNEMFSKLREVANE